MKILKKDKLIFELMDAINKEYNNPNMFIYFNYLLKYMSYDGKKRFFNVIPDDKFISKVSGIKESVIAELREQLKSDFIIFYQDVNGNFTDTYTDIITIMFNVDYLLSCNNEKLEDFIQEFENIIL